MTELFGLALVFIVALSFIYIAILMPEIRTIILVALILRIIMIIIGHYYVSLPDSLDDALTIESLAWFWAEDGKLGFLLDPEKYSIDNIYSYMIALPYSILGRSTLIPLAFNLSVSMATIILGWHLSKKIWNRVVARNMGWIIALYPSIILYSSVTLREVYVWFFLLLTINSIINWNKTNESKQIIITLINFFLLSLFHGPLLLGAFIFLFIVILRKFKEIYPDLKMMKIKAIDILILSIAFGIVINFLLGNIDISKLPNFDFNIIFKEILNRSAFATRGDASYPDFTQYNSIFEILYKTPIKLFFFFGSPFPWDVKKLGHFIVMFDSFFYLFLISLILKNLRYIWSNYTLRILLIIFIFYSIIFAIGIGNFGTGYRHRTKFLILLLLIVAPYLPSIRINPKIINK